MIEFHIKDTSDDQFRVTIVEQGNHEPLFSSESFKAFASGQLSVENLIGEIQAGSFEIIDDRNKE